MSEWILCRYQRFGLYDMLGIIWHLCLYSWPGINKSFHSGSTKCTVCPINYKCNDPTTKIECAVGQWAPAGSIVCSGRGKTLQTLSVGVGVQHDKLCLWG